MNTQDCHKQEIKNSIENDQQMQWLIYCLWIVLIRGLYSIEGFIEKVLRNEVRVSR